MTLFNLTHKRNGRWKPAVAGVFVLAVCLAATLARPAEAAEDPLSGLPDRLDGMTPEEQIGHLRAYLEEGLTDARIHFFLGNAFYAVEELDSAVSHYTLAVKLDQDYAKAYVNMGIAYDVKGQYQMARANYIRAIEINPKDVLAYCHLGFNYSRHEPAKAVEYYHKALEIDPNSAQARYNLGLAFAEAKIFNEALIEWKKVIELDPDGKLGEIAAENVKLIETYMELSD
jgi:tetratricopeptide (TPR) repeat protein